MDLEATVVERLQKLREWQLEQQERLLKQQQMQRDMLTQRQDCMYKALELSIQELDLNDDVGDRSNSNESIVSAEINNKNFVMLHNESDIKGDCIQMLDDKESPIKQNLNSFGNVTSQQQSPPEEIFNNSIENHRKEQPRDKVMSVVENEAQFTLTSSKKEKQRKQFMIDGVAPLPPDKITGSHIRIDDIPIPSPRKDFHTLLEERLKDYEVQSSEKSNASVENKVRKPFLRKGEGLSRFKLNQPVQPSTQKARPRSASFGNNTHHVSQYCKSENKTNKMSRSSKATQLTKNTHSTNVAQKKLSLKNIPLPKKKVRSKSESNTSSMSREDYINEIKNVVELNTSDFHSGTQKELEEVRIFELLEEKAENSSFCSTSSAVVAFLQQSTPFKMKRARYKAESGVVNKVRVTPTIKTPKEQSILKSNKMYKQTTCDKNAGTYKDLPYFINQKMIQDNVHKSTSILQGANENSAIKVNGNKHTLLRNSMHDKQNTCDAADIENDNEVDVSLHVRFSEYNEYKTIGLTDTSSVSTDSIVTKNFSDDKVWSDSSISETSTIEALSMPFEVSQSSIIRNRKVRDIKYKSQFEQCDIEQELSHKTQSYETMRQNNDSNSDVETQQHAHYKDESEFSDTTYQSPDEEESILHTYSQNDLTPQRVENFPNVQILKKRVEKSDNSKIDKYIRSYSNDAEKEGQENKENLDESKETVFKSELLKNRLLELEQEISIFRKENAALSLQRKKLQDDHRSLHKEYTEKEKNFEENRKQAEDRLQEERKKLAREKAALENRMRDSLEKAQQSKLERQEIQILKQEVEKLREEMHTKESRWNAAQSRHKCQMRILKMENSKLKQEIERLQSLKKSNVRAKGKLGTSSNTRAIHEINKQLNVQYKESQKMNDVSSDDDDQKLGAPLTKGMCTANYHNIEEEKEHSYNVNKDAVNEKLQKSQTPAVDIAKKRNLYENLIKEATLDLTDSHEQSVKISENLNEPKPSLNSTCKKLNSRANTSAQGCEKLYKESDVPSDHSNINGNIQLHVQNDYMNFIFPTKAHGEHREKDLTSATQDELSNIQLESTSSYGQSNATVDKQGLKQIQHADGSTEYRFPNGNIKKVFPDQGLTRLIYYNGDVRETNKDGKIKYFYASTRTWHTTMPDGLEILEFADGQIERRSHNGTVEVSFPDGSVRILESDGIEKWSLPDGTLIQILTNGEKILTLPNGQREIHTKTHKRREYPDGTIKLIYLDGTQETRYSNGRIRLKDKDGNLLMDSYQ